MLARIRDTDELYICAYPSFNVNEMLAVARLYELSTAASRKPIIVFNGAPAQTSLSRTVLAAGVCGAHIICKYAYIAVQGWSHI